MLVGEAPCTRDLIRITDHDFSTVSIVSIGGYFSHHPVGIQIPHTSGSPGGGDRAGDIYQYGNPLLYGHGHTVYRLHRNRNHTAGRHSGLRHLMTTRYKSERLGGADKAQAVSVACQTSVKSIMVSALSFFAATFGVGLYSNIDMISSLCTLMARGALISMASVIFILPSMLMVFDALIRRTTWGMKTNKAEKEQEASQA